MYKRFLHKMLESLCGLATGFLDLLPGLMLVLFYSILSKNLWASMLIPPLLSFRGSVLGSFVGRLSTGLHLGTMKTTLRKNTKFFYSILTSMWYLSILGSLLIILVIYVISLLFYHINIDIINILILFCSTLFVSKLITLVFIMAVTDLTYRLGLDPDYILYPITSSLADIIVTITFIIMLYIGFLQKLTVILGILTAVFYLSILFLKFLPIDIETFKRTMYESLLSLLLIVVVVSITGVVFSEITRRIEKYPQIYLIYPSLLTMVGDANSIIGSALTTKLHLGAIKVGWNILKSASIIAPTVLAFEIVIGICGLASLVYAPNPINMIFSLISGNLAFIIVLAINFLVINLTFLFGFDPDHFVNPLISTLADNITTISILIVIIAMGS